MQQHTILAQKGRPAKSVVVAAARKAAHSCEPFWLVCSALTDFARTAHTHTDTYTANQMKAEGFCEGPEGWGGTPHSTTQQKWKKALLTLLFTIKRLHTKVAAYLLRKKSIFGAKKTASRHRLLYFALDTSCEFKVLIGCKDRNLTIRSFVKPSKLIHRNWHERCWTQRICAMNFI